jgi:r-opsin
LTACAIREKRYNVIVKGFNAAPLTFGKASTLIILNWIWAFGWSVCPLVGWGYYAMDGMLGTYGKLFFKLTILNCNNYN